LTQSFNASHVLMFKAKCCFFLTLVTAKATRSWRRHKDSRVPNIAARRILHWDLMHKRLVTNTGDSTKYEVHHYPLWTQNLHDHGGWCVHPYCPSVSFISFQNLWVLTFSSCTLHSLSSMFPKGSPRKHAYKVSTFLSTINSLYELVHLVSCEHRYKKEYMYP